MIKKVHAAITNPALPNEGGDASSFAKSIANLWKTMIIVGGLAFLLYFLWGGVEWITAGGEKDKIEKARGKITQGLIGLAILAGSYVIILFINEALGIDIINIIWPTPGT